MNMHRKLIALVLATVMMLSAANALAYDWNTEMGYEFPLKEQVEYTYMIPENPNYKLIQDGAIMEYFREKTGVRIVFQPVPNENYDDKYNITLGSNALPDIISAQRAYQYGPQGLFLNILDYSEYTPNLNRILEQNPEYKDALIASDGGIYHFPAFLQDLTSRIRYSIVYREDILKSLGLEVPADEEGWYALFKAVKEAYPDMIPFCFPKDDWRFSTAFSGYYINDDMFYDQETGKWVFSPATENYKAAVEFARKLYTEGLLDQEFLTLTKNDLDQKFYSGQLFASITNIWGGGTDGMNKLLHEAGLKEAWLSESAPWGTQFGQRFITSTPAVGKYDERQTIAFSKDIKNPEIALAYFDYICYSPEGTLTQGYAIEGKQWTMTAYGPDFLGEQVDKYLSGESSPNVLGGSDRVPRIGATKTWYPEAFKTYNETALATDVYQQRRVAILNDLSQYVDERIEPSVLLFMDEDQLERVGELKTLLHTILYEYRIGFITGRRDMSEWNEMLNQFKNNGYEELTAIYADAQAKFESVQ